MQLGKGLFESYVLSDECKNTGSYGCSKADQTRRKKA